MESIKPIKSEYSEIKRCTTDRRNRPISDWFRSYLHTHAQTLVSSLGRLNRSRYSSMMTIVVISVALTLPCGFYLLVENVKQVTGVLETPHQVSLFLKHSVTNETGKKIVKELIDKPEVKDATLISKEEGLKEFRSYSGFNDALANLEHNPLPVVIRVEPMEAHNQIDKLHGLVLELKRIPGVEIVQIDLEWMERLHSIINLVRRGIFVLSVFLGLAVIFIVGNTIRLELENRKDEIVVAQLVGATNSFVRRPFLYSGFWYGALSGMLALIFIHLVVILMDEPVNQIAFRYNSHFEINGLNLKESVFLMQASIMLGIAGAWLVLAEHLKNLRPK